MEREQHSFILSIGVGSGVDSLNTKLSASLCLNCADPRLEPSPPAELTELPPAASMESGKPPICLSLIRERE